MSKEIDIEITEDFDIRTMKAVTYIIAPKYDKFVALCGHKLDYERQIVPAIEAIKNEINQQGKEAQ